MAATKAPEISVDGRRFLRIPIRTHLLTSADDLGAVCLEAAAPHAEPGDVLFASHKAISITQGRTRRASEVKPSRLARFLSRFVTRTPHGIGIGSPESMQCAIDDCGAARILLAAFVSALGKLVGRRGDFYRVAGPRAANIDAAGTSPVNPGLIVLAPLDPEGAAEELASRVGLPVAIVDANDLGVSILGASKGVDRDLIVRALSDNPLGQRDQMTPIGLLRQAPNIANTEAATPV